MNTRRQPDSRTGRRTAIGLAAAAAVLLGTAEYAAAQDEPTMLLLDGVAAVVNDRVITRSTLNDRIDLALLASGLPISGENRERLRAQVLRTLVDEELRLQAGEDAGISVSEEQVDEAISQIAANNNMSREGFESVLRRGNVPLSALEEQIRAMLTWQGVVGRRIAPRVDVTEEAALEILSRIEDTQGEPEYLLSDLFLAVDAPAQEVEIQELAQTLVEDLRGGGSFAALASQFSDAVGASDGGDLGWVLGAQLDPDLRAAIEAMQVGQVSDPIRTAGGYHIVALRDQRPANTPQPEDDMVELARLILPLPNPPTQAAFVRAGAALEDIAATVRGCDALLDRAGELGAPPVAVNSAPLRELPGPLQTLLQELEIGEPTDPIRLPEGLGVFMVCERTAAEDMNLDQVLQTLRAERIDLAQQRYLRDMRRDATVDIRVGE